MIDMVVGFFSHTSFTSQQSIYYFGAIKFIDLRFLCMCDFVCMCV